MVPSLPNQSAIAAAVNLSIRYLPSRQLPDKAISLLDTASARIALTQGAKPEIIESLEQMIRYQENELMALAKEQALFGGNEADIAELTQQREQKQNKLDALNSQWNQEVELVDKIKAIQSDISNASEETENPEQMTEELNKLRDELAELQGETPLVHALVDEGTIAEVIANWTGIPVGSMLSDEINKLLTLETELDKRSRLGRMWQNKSSLKQFVFPELA